MLLVVSPSCTFFSNIQNINKDRRDPAVVRRELIEGRVHPEWCCRLCRQQMARGAYLLHEHPALAKSWDEPCIRAVMQHRGVSRITADQCQFGQEDLEGNPICKPTGFMWNAIGLLRTLDVRCLGRGGLCSRTKGGRHVPCLGMRARRAAIFQE